ncbi:MAG: mechanosensitive ion channel family protein [Gammaproteobacteria bacterium]|jgi:small conductance mechanosensitive channel|nr:MAG: mechanosensitive ion channel family protein [Gammaproteobacteria bacterium]
MEEQLDMVEEVYQLIVNFLVNYSFQLLGAVLVLVLGFVVGGWVSRAVLRLMERRNVDVTLREFLAGVVKMIVVGVFLLAVLDKLGISVTPLIAAIGGLAVGASFAIQGPVSNYGAGLVIILTRMFKLGDTITVQGCSGQVEEISLATTILKTEDGELIVIPNRQIAGEIHTNSFENRVVEAQVGVAYSDDPERAISVIREALAGIDGVTSEPAPQVGIAEFGDSSVNVDYRFWVPTNRYFEVKHAANLAVFRALGAGGLNIPFPQREVRMLGEVV